MFEQKNLPQGVRTIMSAELTNIDRADDWLTDYLAQKHWPIDIFAMRILLREALLNAVTHGSGEDPAKMVEMDIVVGEQKLTMIVRDEGEGFIWNPDAWVDISELDEGGRGLSLMQLYSDVMIYNEKGNQVTLEKCFAMMTSRS